MIIDEIENSNLYPYGAAWNVAFEFLVALDDNAEEGRYVLQGDEMYAVIESYDTRSRLSTLPEMHRKYVDIQMVLSGSEQIAWWPTQHLTPAKPYNPERDIAFLDRPDSASVALDLVPGRFAVFFHGDAHMPGLHIGRSPTRVKKVVVKISGQLLVP